MEDLIAVYADCGINRDKVVWDALQKIYEQTGNKFLFVLDEWDAVFHIPFISKEEQKEYLLFLKWLLKNQSYAEFAYMTGVLPITKYFSGSELNMFVEYDMTTSEKFSGYFGFSDTEVDRLYNPRSVVLALADNQLRNYWTSSGPYDELFFMSETI